MSLQARIHDELYTINFVDSKNDKLISPEDDRIHWGITRFEEKGIYIRDDLDEGTTKKILIHELVHAFVESYGFGQVDWDEEIVADFLEQYFQEIANIIENYKIYRAAKYEKSETNAQIYYGD